MIHVTPTNDLKEHIEEGTQCWCNPELDYSGAEIIVIHNSADGREYLEQAEKILTDHL